MTAADPDTMTLDQCRDELARMDGWAASPDGIYHKPEWGADHVACVRAGLLPRHDHPIPPTLDAIAAAMPEGWYWWVNFSGLSIPFMAVAVERVPKQPQIEVRADSELLARARLVVKVRRHSACLAAGEEEKK